MTPRPTTVPARPAPPTRRSRKNTDGRMKYLLEDIPRELIARAKEKGRLQDPPVSVKWVLITLLKQWVEGRRAVSLSVASLLSLLP